jgi:hypothetical protein
MVTMRRRVVDFEQIPNGSTASEPDMVVDVPKDPSRQTLVAISTKIDRILQAYVKFTSSATNQDKILKVVQYSLWLLARFYSKSYYRSALEKLSEEISWTRYVNRFFGFPASLEGATSGSWGSPKALGKALAWTMIGYYPLEHLAYLKWKVPDICLPSRSDSRLAAKVSAWSCRFWFAYIVLDIVRSTFALTSNNEREEEKVSNPASRTERLQILRNALFFLPAINWSLPKWDTDPLLSSEVCNGLMWLESVVCMYQGVSNVQS